jgi:Domain of unknown function DUF29
MAQSDKNSLRNYLIRLMWHIIKWYTQPWARSKSWYNSIQDSRKQIEELLAEYPTMFRLIDGMISAAFKKAKKKAEGEIKTQITELSRKQLFEDDYKLEE